MKISRFACVLVVAALAGICTSTLATAGSLDHSPRWRQMKKTTPTVVVPPASTAPVNNPPAEVNGDSLDTPANPGTTPGNPPQNEIRFGGDTPAIDLGGNGQPHAVPSPSAFAAGLVLLTAGLIRRRRTA